MSAVGALLQGLPLQPEESERDVLDAKSQLFQKYFSLFMNLLNDCLQGQRVFFSSCWTSLKDSFRLKTEAAGWAAARWGR